MTSADDVLHGNDGGITGVIAGRAMSGEHAGDGVGPVERCEPLNISQWVGICAELRWEFEDDTDLRRTKTYS